MRLYRTLFFAFVLFLVPASVLTAGPKRAVSVVFMEPVEGDQGGETSLYQRVDDTKQLRTYHGWLENESAVRAMELYRLAWKTARQRTGSKAALPPYHIALIEGGNHAAVGFRLLAGGKTEDHAKDGYIKLGPTPDRFKDTLLHETGHVVLATLSGESGVPRRSVAAIPHTTSALTDRGTAFDEGFAIHLETLDAHLSDDPAKRHIYRHEGHNFGTKRIKTDEYYRHASDLLNYAQTVARYYEVRENNYAFASACQRPDYLRVQLDKARDFATLRNANQLLGSEGFIASFFFAYTMRGEGIPTPQIIARRQEQLFAAIADALSSDSLEPDSPCLLLVVESLLRLYPAEAKETADVINDLSHGVFVDANAAALWRQLYEAGIRLDIKGLPRERIESARQQWRTTVLKDPKILFSRVGPQIPCIVKGPKVSLVALGGESPLAFDVNTVQPGIMRLVPGITEDEAVKWLAARDDRAFASPEDFKKRAGLGEETLTTIDFEVEN